MDKKEQIINSMQTFKEAKKGVLNAVETFIKDKGELNFPTTSFDIACSGNVKADNGEVYLMDEGDEKFPIRELNASDIITLASICVMMG